MAVNILGPVAGGQVTARPARSNVLGATDTWFRGCSAPNVPDGTIPDPDQANDILANFRTLFAGAGIALDGADDMLLRAVKSIGIRYGVDTGAANNITVAFPVPVTALYDGLLLSVKIAANNTGATNFIFTDLANQSVPVKRRDGTALAADDLIAAQGALFIYLGGVLQVLANGVYAAAGGGGGSPTAGICGQLVLTTGNVALAGTLKANGAAISRATYADLWTFAQASGRIVSDADWQNASLRKWASYSTGDGATTFRLPDLRGEFLRMYDDARGVDAARDLGTQQAEMIGPHTHPASAVVTHNAKGGGIFLAAGANGEIPNNNPADISVTVQVLTNTGTENRVRNVAVLPCIVY